MTQPTDRPGINHLTSDMLDQLYAERDALLAEIERMKILVAASSEDGQAIRMAGRFAEKAIENGERADQAEATLNAVRDELTAIEQTHDGLDCECEAEASAGTTRRIRAVLDQHGQTPKETT